MLEIRCREKESLSSLEEIFFGSRSRGLHTVSGRERKQNASATKGIRRPRGHDAKLCQSGGLIRCENSSPSLQRQTAYRDSQFGVKRPWRGFGRSFPPGGTEKGGRGRAVRQRESSLAWRPPTGRVGTDQDSRLPLRLTAGWAGWAGITTTSRCGAALPQVPLCL